MDEQEIAPPFENWAAHLRVLDDRELTELAKDYRWLEDENPPSGERHEFHRRRQAVAAELERRGMTELARMCKPSKAA